MSRQTTNPRSVAVCNRCNHLAVCLGMLCARCRREMDEAEHDGMEGSVSVAEEDCVGMQSVTACMPNADASLDSVSAGDVPDAQGGRRLGPLTTRPADPARQPLGPRNADALYADAMEVAAQWVAKEWTK